MKKIHLMSCLMLISATLVISSCKRDKDEEADTETQTSSDNFVMESQVNDMFKEIDAAANDASLGKAGPTITIDSNSTPKKMTIDYGTSTICADGKIRSGKIIVTWTGRYRDAGTVITVTPDAFYQNGNRLDGTKTITNNGRNSSGNLTYTINVSNAVLKSADGKTLLWNANRVREWVSGENTLLNWADDVYLITGSANGTARNGLTYTAQITQPVRIDLSCQHRVTAGEIEIKPQGKLTRTVNYGNGGCDNTITIKIGNKTYTVN